MWSPYIGNTFITRAQYKQMIGRAGRAGIDTSAESILIIPYKDKKKSQLLLQGPVDICKSSLNYQNGKGLRELTLSLIGLKVSLISLISNCYCIIILAVILID